MLTKLLGDSGIYLHPLYPLFLFYWSHEPWSALHFDSYSSFQICTTMDLNLSWCSCLLMIEQSSIFVKNKVHTRPWSIKATGRGITELQNLFFFEKKNVREYRIKVLCFVLNMYFLLFSTSMVTKKKLAFTHLTKIYCFWAWFCGTSGQLHKLTASI